MIPDDSFIRELIEDEDIRNFEEVTERYFNRDYGGGMMKLLCLRYEPTHSDFILDASAIKTIVPVGSYQNASFMIYDQNDETYEFDCIYRHGEFIRVYEMTTLYEYLTDENAGGAR